MSLPPSLSVCFYVAFTFLSDFLKRTWKSPQLRLFLYRNYLLVSSSSFASSCAQTKSFIHSLLKFGISYCPSNNFKQARTWSLFNSALCFVCSHVDNINLHFFLKWLDVDRRRLLVICGFQSFFVFECIYQLHIFGLELNFSTPMHLLL